MQKLRNTDHVVGKHKRTLAVVLALGLTFWLAGCTIETPEMDNNPSPPLSQEATEDVQESSAADEQTADPQPSEALAPGTFRLSFTNWDDATYADLEIWIRGYGSWFPNPEGDLLENVGPFEIGQTLPGELFVYPFGRSGIEVPVTLSLSLNHISNSPRDIVQVYIEDGVLFVSGSPIAEDLEVPLR